MRISEYAGVVLAVAVVWGPPVTAGGTGRVSATVVNAPNRLAEPDSSRPDGSRPDSRAAATRRLGLNVDGLAQDDSAPGDPSGVSAVAGPKVLVEVAGNRLAVLTRQGATRCSTLLPALFGVAPDVSGARLLYDAAYDRYSLVATVPAAAPGAPAMLYLAASRGSDPCAGWWAYRLTFGGAQFPPGAWLDHPYLGQDPRALLLSSNNAVGDRYVGSAAFALPKAAVYAGATAHVPTFAVPYSTAPVTTSDPDADSYYMAAVPGLGYQLYRMVNSAGPGTALLDDATVAAPFAAPVRAIRQCTDTALDPSDGRLATVPVRAGDYVWFAHEVDYGGRPGVRYGAVDLYDHTAYTAAAGYSATSDDFSPSIGVADAGQGLDRVWLNWAYTDPGTLPCTDVSAVVDTVAPGDGVPDRVGTGMRVVRGNPARAGTRLTAYSSVAVDPAAVAGCGAGAAAVTAQQYFAADGRWRTRIARIESC